MIPFGSECCKRSKLHVDFFLESYTRSTTPKGILKNCTVANIAIKAFLSAICFRMLQRLQITCGFVSGVVHKAYHSQWNFIKLYCS